MLHRIYILLAKLLEACLYNHNLFVATFFVVVVVF